MQNNKPFRNMNIKILTEIQFTIASLLAYQTLRYNMADNKSSREGAREAMMSAEHACILVGISSEDTFAIRSGKFKGLQNLNKLSGKVLFESDYNFDSKEEVKSPGQILSDKRKELLEETIGAIIDFFRYSQGGRYQLVESVDMANDVITDVDFDPNGDLMLLTESDEKYSLGQMDLEALLSLLAELESSKPMWIEPSPALK